MRRSVLAVVGTLAGTALMLGAKIGTAQSQAAAAINGNGVGTVPAFAPPNPAAPAPALGARGASGMPNAPGPAPATETGNQPNGTMNPPPAGTAGGGGGVAMPPAAPQPQANGGARDGNYSGSTMVQRYGYNVSVTITVAGGRITAANGACNNAVGESQRYCAGAVASLQQETLAAQSANIATVSGATYTSAAYRSSLQAAIDQA